MGRPGLGLSLSRSSDFQEDIHKTESLHAEVAYLFILLYSYWKTNLKVTTIKSLGSSSFFLCMLWDFGGSRPAATLPLMIIKDPARGRHTSLSGWGIRMSIGWGAKRGGAIVCRAVERKSA